MTNNLFFDEDLELTVARCGGFMMFDDFKELALGSTELMKSRSAHRQLVLLQDMKVLSKEIQDWIQSEWFPTAIASGLKYLGFVIPSSALAKMSMHSANKEAEKDLPIDIRYFGSEEEARTWIGSQHDVEQV